MENLLSRLNEMDFDSTNLVATWTKRKQMMKLYLNAVMGQKTEEKSILWYCLSWVSVEEKFSILGHGRKCMMQLEMKWIRDQSLVMVGGGAEDILERV